MCRNFGISRWPYRKVQSLNARIIQLEKIIPETEVKKKIFFFCIFLYLKLISKINFKSKEEIDAQKKELEILRERKNFLLENPTQCEKIKVKKKKKIYFIKKFFTNKKKKKKLKIGNGGAFKKNSPTTTKKTPKTKQTKKSAIEKNVPQMSKIEKKSSLILTENSANLLNLLASAAFSIQNQKIEIPIEKELESSPFVDRSEDLPSIDLKNNSFQPPLHSSVWFLPRESSFEHENESKRKSVFISLEREQASNKIRKIIN